VKRLIPVVALLLIIGLAGCPNNSGSAPAAGHKEGDGHDHKKDDHKEGDGHDHKKGEKKDDHKDGDGHDHGKK
jgi:ABC-type Zn2+ transport system substrate-binding protein/surface adhesin